MSSSKERAEGSAVKRPGGREEARGRGTEMESGPVGCQCYANMTFTSEETTSPNQIRRKFG